MEVANPKSTQVPTPPGSNASPTTISPGHGAPGEENTGQTATSSQSSIFSFSASKHRNPSFRRSTVVDPVFPDQEAASQPPRILLRNPLKRSETTVFFKPTDVLDPQETANWRRAVSRMAPGPSRPSALEITPAIKPMQPTPPLSPRPHDASPPPVIRAPPNTQAQAGPSTATTSTARTKRRRRPMGHDGSSSWEDLPEGLRIMRKTMRQGVKVLDFAFEGPKREGAIDDWAWEAGNDCKGLDHLNKQFKGLSGIIAMANEQAKREKREYEAKLKRLEAGDNIKTPLIVTPPSEDEVEMALRNESDPADAEPRVQCYLMGAPFQPELLAQKLRGVKRERSAASAECEGQSPSKMPKRSSSPDSDDKMVVDSAL